MVEVLHVVGEPEAPGLVSVEAVGGSLDGCRVPVPPSAYGVVIEGEAYRLEECGAERVLRFLPGALVSRRRDVDGVTGLVVPDARRRALEG